MQKFTEEQLIKYTKISGSTSIDMAKWNIDAVCSALSIHRLAGASITYRVSMYGAIRVLVDSQDVYVSDGHSIIKIDKNGEPSRLSRKNKENIGALMDGYTQVNELATIDNDIDSALFLHT